MEDMCCDCQMFQIPERYWGQVLEELIDNGVVRGFLVLRTKDGTIIQMTDEARITMAGRNFLVENIGMQRAKAFLGNAFEVVLDGIIAALV